MKKNTFHLLLALLALSLAINPVLAAPPQAAQAQAAAEWTVSVIINELHDITDNDAYQGFDFYFHTTLYGPDDWTACGNEESGSEDDYDIEPDWTCSIDVAGDNPQITAEVWVWDDDWPSEDDQLDIHPSAGWDRIELRFWPATHRLNIAGVDDDGDGIVDEDDNGNGVVDENEDSRCAAGRITMQGEQGDDRARIVFTVTGTVEGANNGDSDGDGLSDAAERCGVDVAGDGDIDVDLPGMGADPFRKDLFVEIDWMVDSDGLAPADHSHEPWLPALINAWHELDQAPVTNPPAPDGVARRGGIALHVDVGALYANYALDFDGDGVNDVLLDANGDGLPDGSVGASGNIDVDPDGPGGPLLPDGIVDIGNLGALGAGTPGGGTPLPENPALSRVGADNIRVFSFSPVRWKVFRYVIFADQLSIGTNSGITPWGTACANPPCGGVWIFANWRPTDFVVSLGAFGNQQGAMVGPAGLPVMGSINQHAGVFLHELGHSLGLGHGGSDAINRKPNYVSVMNYNYSGGKGVTYDLNGDGLADPLLGFDFNQDGLPDNQRHVYSADLPFSNFAANPARGGLPPQIENNLDETADIDPDGNGQLVPDGIPDGVGAGQAAVFYGPQPVDVDPDGIGPLLPDGVCDAYCALPANSVITVFGSQPIDWNRDGDTNDVGVSSLAFPPAPAANISTDLNADSSGAIFPETLTGFNDYNFLQNQTLMAAGPDASREEEAAFIHSLVRVNGLTEAQMIAACDATSAAFMKFDELAPGVVMTDQYAAQGVNFLADGIRQPTVVGPAGRNGLPTASPQNSLLNWPVPPADSGGVPMVIAFDPPVRLVSLRLGRVTQGNPLKDTAVLTAFDADGFPMGSVQTAIPDFHQGITTFLGMGAIFPDQLIARVELNYVLNPLLNPLEPEHIDDLRLCRELVARQPNFPDGPQFGQPTVEVQVSAEVRHQVDTGHEEQPLRWEGTPLNEIPIQWDRLDAGQAGNSDTDFSLNLSEGEHLSLTAPALIFDPQWGPLTLIYWRQGENIYFDRGAVEMASRILRDATFTAVYRPAYQVYMPLVIRPSGGASPTPTPTATPKASPTPTATPTSTPTASPTPTLTPTSTPTSSPTPTSTPTSTPTASPTPTSTPTSSPTPTSTPTASPTPTSRPTSSPTPTVTSTPTATFTPTPTATLAPVTVTLTPVADAYIYSAAPTTNYGSATTLYAGSQSASATGRALFRFNLSGLPAGATVISASFQANLAQASASPAMLDVELLRIDTAWQEATVTWNTPITYTAASNVTGVGTAPGYYSWNVTSLAQWWVNGGANNGLALRSKNETTLGWRGFSSREIAASSPRLVITYQP